MLHSSRRERSWVLKRWHFPVTAVLEGMVAADRLAVGGSAEHSIENRRVHLLYIAYVAACPPKMNEVAVSSLV